jgi:hypothetical protein
LQLILTFIILSVITLVAILLIVLNKNSRSAKLQQIAQTHNWHYQEFIDFDDSIKNANFGLLNYSQNAIFRHFIQADSEYQNLSFKTFDCRAIEPSGIHNSTLILFDLKIPADFKKLHLTISQPQQDTDAFSDSSHQQIIKRQYQSQKLSKLAHHQIPVELGLNDERLSKTVLYANQPGQAHQLLMYICSTNKSSMSLNHWLLAHPHLHIELSSGMLLAYKKNQLIDEDSLVSAVDIVAELAGILSCT